MRVAPVPLGVASAFPLFTPGKYRKIPCRAVGVSTRASIVSFWSWSLRSYNTKKNVLFLSMGPPRLTVLWCRLYHTGTEDVRRLAAQVFAFNAEFRRFHVAAP